MRSGEYGIGLVYMTGVMPRLLTHTPSTHITLSKISLSIIDSQAFVG